MTLEQLRIFVAVAEHLSFTKAAYNLYLTQPTVSAAVANLEKHHGVPLFHRVGRRIELTEAGQLLLEPARTILLHVAEADSLLQELSGLERGKLALATTQTIANYWLASFLCDFRQRYPAIQLNLLIENTAQVEHAVLNGEVEIGIVEGKTGNHLLQQKIVGGDELILIVGRNHPWAQRGHVSFDELLTATWIMREIGSGTRQIFEDALRKWGIEPERLNISLELPSGELIKTTVEAGAGVAVISNLLVINEMQLGLLHSPNNIRLARSFYLLTHKKRYCSKASQAFIALLEPIPSPIYEA